MDDAIAVADKKLIDTLTAASAGAPVSRLFNSGNHDTYITHQIISINPRNNADDEASSYEILFGIDIYSRSNYIALMQRMITQLESADFSVHPFAQKSMNLIRHITMCRWKQNT